MNWSGVAPTTPDSKTLRRLDIPNTGGDDDNKVVQFPTTPEERRALHRAKQEAERQRLARLFVDEAAGDQALFRTPSGECYADLIIEAFGRPGR